MRNYQTTLFPLSPQIVLFIWLTCLAFSEYFSSIFKHASATPLFKKPDIDLLQFLFILTYLLP